MMNYGTEDAIRLHNYIKQRLSNETPDEIHAHLTSMDPQLLALTLVLHALKEQPYGTA